MELVRPGREVDVAGVDALRAVDAFEIAVRAAVDVVADDHLVAGGRQLRERGRRRRTRGERDAVAAGLQRRHRSFEALAGGVLRAGVLVAVARAARRRPARTCWSGRSAARVPRSAGRVRPRRGPRWCRRRTRARMAPSAHHGTRGDAIDHPGVAPAPSSLRSGVPVRTPRARRRQRAARRPGRRRPDRRTG